jgi:membrane-bound lytic murein transglycosylase D
MFARMRALLLVAFGLGSLATTAANAGPSSSSQATDVHAGAQAVPPVHAAEPTLSQDLEQRRNIRGCNADESCARPNEVLHEYELEAFPRPGGNPWIDERSVPASRPIGIDGAIAKKVRRPSELRPDQPWLDKLAMPDLPVTWTPKLIDYLMFYKDDPRGRSIMTSWLAAQGRYRDLIVSHLRKAHLPEDLLYDAMIESSYDNEDSSYAGALGLWQFMPENSKIYGLRRDRWVDERMDPLRSTIAQMDYFQDLYQRFGDWQIALAAFNAGYGAVLRSIARYNTNDYYALCAYENGLPWETCLYTPKVLAAAIVGHNRAAFGYTEIKEQSPEQWDEVAVPTSMTFAMIAKVAGTHEEDIKRLNPQLRRGRTPPGEAGYLVRVPAGAKPEFAKKLVELESEWSGYDSYVIAHGERLEDVATTYGISLAQLRKLNAIDREAELEGGTLLVVPRVAADIRDKNKAKAKAKLLGSGVDAKDGEKLIVAIPDKDFVVPNKQRVFYRVVSGDTVASVAKALGVRIADLRTWNGLAEPALPRRGSAAEGQRGVEDEDGKLHPKMVLVAWLPPQFDAAKHEITFLDETELAIVTRGSPEHLDLAEQRAGRVRSEYVAKGKEKLADIAKKFGMGSHDLARINRISYDTVLEKGQSCIVYEVQDPGRSKRADEQWHKTPRARRGKISKERATRTATSPDNAPVTNPSQVDE